VVAGATGLRLSAFHGVLRPINAKRSNLGAQQLPWRLDLDGQGPIALSIKPGGYVGSATIGGKIATGGDGVPAVATEGAIDKPAVAGGISTAGDGADCIQLTGAPIPHGVTVTSASGTDLVPG
jgi:hypothetical protein